MIIFIGFVAIMYLTGDNGYLWFIAIISFSVMKFFILYFKLQLIIMHVLITMHSNFAYLGKLHWFGLVWFGLSLYGHFLHTRAN